MSWQCRTNMTGDSASVISCASVSSSVNGSVIY